MMLLAAGTVFALPVSGTDPPTMANIGYSLRGYDIFRGNPMSISATIDTGFKEPVFSANYSAGSLTPDQVRA